MDIDDRQKEYILEEYRQLRQEILLVLQRTDVLERNALLACGAIWAWLATHVENLQYKMVVWVPLFISVLFALKSGSLRYGQHRITRYLQRIEQTLGLAEGLGWHNVHFMIPKSLPLGVGLWAIFYWIAIIVGNIVAAVLFPRLLLTS